MSDNGRTVPSTGPPGSEGRHDPHHASIASDRDLTSTNLWAEVEEHFQKQHSPAFGKVSGANDLALSPDGSKIAFTGSIWEKLEGHPHTRICTVDIATGEVKVITRGPNDDRLPKWSPDGRTLAFLSDRAEAGVSQVYLLSVGELGEASLVTSKLEGQADTFSWSPDGKELLIVAADPEDGGQADEGGQSDKKKAETAPKWMPKVEKETSGPAGRSLWVYRLADSTIRQIGRRGLTFWAATWCAQDQVFAIVAEEPGETGWFRVKLISLTISTGDEKEVYQPPRFCQLAQPIASPSSTHIAILEAPCSDRDAFAGELLLVDCKTGETVSIPTEGVSVSDAEWLDDDRVFFIGTRDFGTVAGIVHINDKTAKVVWESSESCGEWYPKACIIDAHRFAVVLQSYTRYPEITIISAEDDHPQTLASFDHDGAKWLRSQLGPVEQVSWPAPDGIEIQALLLHPKPDTTATTKKPYPLILCIHGGPIWAFRNLWQLQYAFMTLLVSRGYAILCPNPRGSTGRGRDFAMKIVGDMGGVETQDFLSGVQAMVDRGIADPKRIGIEGISYGGYMTYWLITQAPTTFAAAVPTAGVTDWYTQNTLSIIHNFDEDFLDGPRGPFMDGGLFWTRSPLMFADRVKTPVLHFIGEEDTGVPGVQGLQFHNAVRRTNGGKGVSVLASYPCEGHGIRDFPAYTDYCVRMVDWFETYMPVKGSK